MLEALVFSYGLVTSFVVAGVERNHRAQRANPPMLACFGYAVCTTLGGTALGLFAFATAEALGFV